MLMFKNSNTILIFIQPARLIINNQACYQQTASALTENILGPRFHLIRLQRPFRHHSSKITFAICGKTSPVCYLFKLYVLSSIPTLWHVGPTLTAKAKDEMSDIFKEIRKFQKFSLKTVLQFKNIVLKYNLIETK